MKGDIHMVKMKKQSNFRKQSVEAYVCRCTFASCTCSSCSCSVCGCGSSQSATEAGFYGARDGAKDFIRNDSRKVIGGTANGRA